MKLGETFGLRQRFMMEGALGERLKREFGLRLDAMHRMKIVGGCCGTDGRHMKETARRMGEQER